MKYFALILLMCVCWAGGAHAQDLEQTLGQLNQVMTVAGASTPSSDGSTFLGFSLWALIGGLIFSGIGFVACVYGKKNQEYLIMLTGIAMMVYPYFVRETLWVYLIGVALTAALYFLR